MERTIIKRLSLALAVSLGLNCFFIGYGIARRRFHGIHGAPAAHVAAKQLGTHGFMQRIGLADAGTDIEKVVEAQGAVLRTQHAAVASVREHVTEALQAEPFDAARFSAALAELRAQTAQMQAQMHATFVEVAGKLSPEQRKRVAGSPWFMRQSGGR